MRRMIVAGTAAAAVLAGCTGKKQAPSAIARERFVQANVDLRSVPDTVPNGDSLRAAALRKYRVTEGDLRRFVTVHGRNAEYMSTVWREIADSVQQRYDRTFPLVHPTHEMPVVPSSQPAAGSNQPPIPGQQPPPPGGVPPRMPQRPRPPRIPVGGGRMVPQPTPPAAPPHTPMDTLRRER